MGVIMNNKIGFFISKDNINQIKRYMKDNNYVEIFIQLEKK